jgi:cell division protein FtsI/penicillin-binding protein 2
MAQEPSFEPQNYQKYPDDIRRNRILRDAYEPGSTFKPFVVTCALERSIFNPQDKFFCENGSFKLGKRIIRDHKPHSWLTLSEVVAHSSNIGMVKITGAIDKYYLYDMIKRFGFCKKTALGLSYEHPGLITPLPKWGHYTMNSLAMGYEVSVNSLQLARAFAVFANGGFLVEPQVIKEVADKDGNNVYKNPSQYTPKPIINGTVRGQMNSILRMVVTSGTGTAANIASFTVAGKTGTARKINPDGFYSNQKYRSIFVSYAPIQNSQIVVLVLVDEPKGAYYAGTVIAPFSGKIIEETLKYLNLSYQVASSR